MEKPNITFTTKRNQQGFGVYANNTRLKTPKSGPLSCPTEALAKAMATQMKQQNTQSPLYRLTSFMLEQDRVDLTKQLVAFLDTDLTCYYAKTPTDLVQWQKKHWQPVMDWAKTKGVAPLEVTSYTRPLSQPAAAKKALNTLLETLTPSEFTACFMTGKLAGSVLLGASFAKGVFSAEQVHHAAYADELYQQQRYGKDGTLAEQLNEGFAQLKEVAQFLMLNNT